MNISKSFDKTIPYFMEYAEDVIPAIEAEGAEGEELVIPEDLSALEDEALANLHSSSVDAFNALFGVDGSDLNDDGIAALSVLTKGIQRVKTELDSRTEAQAARGEQAAALAAQAGLVTPATEELAAEPEAAEPASKDIRINLAGLRRPSSQMAALPETEKTGPSKMSDIVKATPEFAGFKNGQGLNWSDIGLGIDRRLASFNRTQWEQANAAGREMRQQLSFAVINKPMDQALVVKSADPIHIDEIMQRASSESRLEGNSLVASGGWCAPSEVTYDLCELESRDGIFEAPEVGISRGGLKYTPGPDFSTIYSSAGFQYTEAQDIAGTYAVDANGIGTGGAGTKRCYEVPCPTFTDARMSFSGMCINANLLQQRGFPEVIARTVRGALVAHDHKVSAGVLTAIEAGSTAVTMPASQVGATAPILTAIELQAEHLRTVNRLSRTKSLEAVFPFWVRGAIRSDLARRQGVDLLAVTDAQILDWFTLRGIAPQFVYNWNDLTGAAGAMLSWPASVKFLIYPAGTWVKGVSDIITLDTIYDSTQLGNNDFTALFTEEGWLVAKLCTDSRVVTVNICADGATQGGVSIACDGSQSGTAQI